MSEVILIEKDEFMGLSIEIAEAIIAYSKKSYGFTMLSRDTGKEEDDDTMLGVLLPPIQKVVGNKEK